MGRAVRHMGGTGDNDMLATWHDMCMCMCMCMWPDSASRGRGGGVMILDNGDMGEDVGDCFGK